MTPDKTDETKYSEILKADLKLVEWLLQEIDSWKFI